MLLRSFVCVLVLLAVCTNVGAQKKKVAVLGSGLGAMTTAFYMSQDPQFQEKYDMTVYSLGWRLGGKAASGRNTADLGYRIQEHGLHMFFGFYNNAFTLMQDAYKVNNRSAGTPLATWQEALWQDSDVAAPQITKNGWRDFQMSAPVMPGTPGPGPDPSLWTLFKKMLDWIEHHHNNTNAFCQQHQLFCGLITDFIGQVKQAEKFVEHNVLPEHWREKLLSLVLRSQQNTPEADIAMADCVYHTLLAFAKAILDDNLMKNGLDQANTWNLPEYLIKHGMPKDLTLCPLIRSAFDAIFGFKAGNTNDPQGAAGTGIFCFMNLLFNYRGSFFWRFQAGMGDTIITPLYQILKSRGVKFNFFSKVTNLRYNDNTQTVTAIDINVQATVKGGKEYDPLITVKGLPVWTDRPDYEQLVEGEAIRNYNVDLESYYNGWLGSANVTLHVGTDYDIIVLGISTGALPFMASELRQARQWDEHMTYTGLVATQAIQLWLYNTAKELGYDNPVRDGQLMYTDLSAFAEPFDTWADMTNVLPTEDWSQSAVGVPASVQYFLGVLPYDTTNLVPFTDKNWPERATQQAHDNFVDWATQNIGFLWPNGVKNGMDSLWASVLAPMNVTGVDRFAKQWIRANVEPTELYVLSLPNTMQYRIRPDRSGIVNLFPVGDWTDNGLNVGCAEAAITSGMVAAKAISGYPATYTSYYHPFNATEAL